MQQQKRIHSAVRYGNASILNSVPGLALLCLLLFGLSTRALAGDDDIPFFVGVAGAPNIMFIFDNSDSMQDIPYLKPDNSAVRPSGWYWRQGVKLNADNTVQVNASNNPVYDYDLYPTDFTNTIPDQTLVALPTTAVTPPENLPGASTPGLTSTMTSYTSTWRIYDTTLNWGDPLLANNSLYAANYQGRVVEVRANDGTVQHRLITTRNTSGKYFSVNTALVYEIGKQPYTYTILTGTVGFVTGTVLIDIGLDWTSPYLVNDADFNRYFRYRTVDLFTPDGTRYRRTITARSTANKSFTLEGGTVDYTQAATPATNYTYTILGDGPGRVTRARTELNYVTDADVDWDTVNANFSSQWDNRTIVVTAGTNLGEQRRIDWIAGDSTGSKYWAVDENFSNPCDQTTRYKIIGMPQDDRYASGGNHPASKLYQAKQAMTLFLTDPSLKSITPEGQEKYNVNMGFATYLSARIPQITARYYRKIAAVAGQDASTSLRAKYTRQSTHTGSQDYSSPNSLRFASWETSLDGISGWTTNYLHTPVTSGYTFYRRFTPDYGCTPQVVRYTITSIVKQNESSYRYNYQSDPYTAYSWYTYQTITPEVECATIPNFATTYPPPATNGTWTLLTSGMSCYEAPTCSYTAAVPAQLAYYTSTNRSTLGYNTVADPAAPQYVDPVSLQVKPYNGYAGTSWTAKLVPDPEAGDYTLLSANLTNVPINSGGTLGTITANTYDTSYFRYPGSSTGGVEDSNHPHGWSYKRTLLPYIYGAGTWSWTTWPDTIQPTPYFPDTAHPNPPGVNIANTSGDDQVIFVHLPPYSTTVNSYFGDDYTGANIGKIVGYTSLSRINSPNLDAPTYDFTIMPYSPGSLAMNSSEQVPGMGTPLAATLEDVKTYYESYIQQDPLCRQGCRDNYVILLTDGLETCADDPVQDPVDAATALYAIEYSEGHRLKTYVIGFGLDTASQASLNNIALAGGTGAAYFANDVQTLVNVLVDEITSAILQNTYNRTAPVLTSYVSGEDQRVYSAYFEYPVWKGHLKATNVDHDTSELLDPPAAWGGDCDGDGENDGDAGCVMKNNGRGTVYSSTGTDASLTRLVFAPDIPATVTDLKPLLNPAGLLDINSNGTAGEDLDAEIIMRYTLDPGYQAPLYQGSRDPDWLLGDIYHSVPVTVSYPKFVPPAGHYPGYAEFKADLDGTNEAENIPGAITRPGRIYVGANDGMLHAFKVDNGQEAWAYIPRAVLGRLSGMKDGHRFSVDLTIRASDIYSPGGVGTIWPAVPAGQEKEGWHTVLASGLRQGGLYYYALDVTDADDPLPMWEMTDQDADPNTRDLGQTWSTPAFGRIMIDGVNKYVVFVGGGYSTNADTGNNVYILDAANGTVLWEIPIGDASTHVPSEILVQVDSSLSSTNYGNVTVAYVADTSGDLYKLTGLNDELGGDSWGPAAVLLNTGTGKVFHRPTVSKVRGNCTVTINSVDYTINANTTFIVYGTGDETTPLDAASTDRIYEIADPPLTRVDDPTVTKTLVWEQAFDIGEKMLSNPTAYEGAVYFTTFAPVGGCGRGSSYLWGLTLTKCGQAGDEAALRYYEGGEPIAANTDASTENDEKKIYIGEGVAELTVTGTGILTQSSGDELGFTPVDGITKMLYWRENY